MKNFVLLHYGFETPTKEIMESWGQWFESIKDSIVDHGSRFGPGKEIEKNETRDLPLDKKAITGYTTIKAKDMNEAEKIAESCPSIACIRVYEAMDK